MIGDLNGAFRSRYFIRVVNERTRFASCTSAFKSAWLVISLKMTQVLSHFETRFNFPLFPFVRRRALARELF